MNEKEFEKKLALLDQLQSACTHCGLCSEACATFELTGWEHESPRGRLHVAAQFLHGHISPQSNALSTFDRCLGCQACEPLCPHQVRYSQVRNIIQELRRQLKTSPSTNVEKRKYQQWLTFAQRIGNVCWRHYGKKWLAISSLDSQSLGSFVRKRKRPQIGQPTLAVCCMQDLFQHDVIEQTLIFLQRLGYSFEVDYKQPCCGAIFERLVQGGEESVCYPKQQGKAAFLQKKSLRNFLQWMTPNTYFLSRGCQSFVGQVDQLSDLYTWIEHILFRQQFKLLFSQPQVVYYQPYCRFQKGEKDSIFRLLQKIQGLTICEFFSPYTCCGGYCGETFLHPKHAQALAWKKISQLPDSATVIVTSSDCWSLFKTYASNRNLTIYHPLQLLVQALVQ